MPQNQNLCRIKNVNESIHVYKTIINKHEVKLTCKSKSGVTLNSLADATEATDAAETLSSDEEEVVIAGACDLDLRRPSLRHLVLQEEVSRGLGTLKMKI